MFTFIFPLLLFMLLGSVYAGHIYGVPAAQALLAALIGYGCAMVAFAGLAITLVIRREQAILKRLRATPLPPASYLALVLTSTLLVFALETVALFLLGRASSGRRSRRVGSLVLLVVLGSVGFAAIGVALGGADPLGRRLVRGRQPHRAADGVPHGRVRADAPLPAFLRAIGDVLPLKYLVDLLNAVYLHNTRSGRSRGDGRPRRLGRSRGGRCRVEVPMGAENAMMEPSVAFRVREHERPALEVRVNFGVFAGRQVTPAEIDDLARALSDDVAVVRDRRGGAARVRRRREVSLHQVVIEIATTSATATRGCERRRRSAERWARDCIATGADLGELGTDL